MTAFIRPDTPQNSTSSHKNDDQQWAERTLREVLLTAYKEQRSTRLWRNIWRSVFFLCFLAVFILNKGDNENNRALQNIHARTPHTAIIDISGEISQENDPVKVLREGMENVYKNKYARAIIIRANSPGGSPVLSNIAFDEIQRMKQNHSEVPVYVVVEDMCASGCYYLAAAADKIYADPSSLVGSIGVIGSSFDATELMQKLGIKRRVRIAGKNKDMGDPFSSETPEQAEIWQQMLNQIHQAFIEAVKKGRGARLQENRYPDLYSGRIFTGIEGKQAGLIDDFGNVYSVARDVVGQEELVDYTPQDQDITYLLNRYLGAKVEETFNAVSQQIW